MNELGSILNLRLRHLFSAIDWHCTLCHGVREIRKSTYSLINYEYYSRAEGPLKFCVFIAVAN